MDVLGNQFEGVFVPQGVNRIVRYRTGRSSVVPCDRGRAW
jgi:hypothetical protein